MELLAGVLALYLIAKVGWPVIKFMGLIVALGMVLQSCHARADAAQPRMEVTAPGCLQYEIRAQAEACQRAVEGFRPRMGKPMQVKGDR